MKRDWLWNAMRVANWLAWALIIAACVQSCRADDKCRAACGDSIKAACDTDSLYRAKRAGCIGDGKAWVVEFK